MHKNILFIHSFASVHVGGFYLLSTMDKTAMNKGIKMSLQAPVFNYFVYIQRMELLGHVVLFSIVFAPFFLPINSARGFQLLHILSNFLLFGGFCFVLITAILMSVR